MYCCSQGSSTITQVSYCERFGYGYLVTQVSVAVVRVQDVLTVVQISSTLSGSRHLVASGEWVFSAALVQAFSLVLHLRVCGYAHHEAVVTPRW